MKTIYTSYFGNVSKLNEDLCPISIAGRPPEGWSGKEYKVVAPSWSIWKEWHDSTAPDRDEQYIKRFQKEILKKLDPRKVVEDLYRLADGKAPCLICYERPTDFCHRHLVAEWLAKKLKGEVDAFEVFF